MRSASALMSDSFALLIEKFGLFFSIFIIPGLLIAVCSNLIVYTSSDSLLYGVDLSSHNLDLSLRPILGVVIGLLSMTLSIAITKAAQSAVSVKETYVFTYQKFGSYFLVSMMAGIIMMLGLVLLILPGIVFMTWFIFATYIVLFENKFGVDALKTSKAYVKGKFFLVLGRSLFGVIAIAVLGIFIGILLNLLFFLPFIALNVPIASIVLGTLTDGIMTPLLFIYLYFMYEDVKKDFFATAKDLASVPEAPIVTPTGV